MESPRREADIARLKLLRDELEHLGRGEFLKLVEQWYGSQFAGLVARLGTDDSTRAMMKDMVDKRLEQLGVET